MSSGGGAGKVYFVLYLAVVLELLIIIVERDEAEEHLHQKTQEAMKIVESILSQLQSGSGTEGMTTRPQDEITIPPSGVDVKQVLGTDIKPFREYVVEVGVTDVSSSITKREMETDKEYHERLETLVKLANVEQIQYQVFYSRSEDPANAPPFPNDIEAKERGIDFDTFEPGQIVQADGAEYEWEFLGMKELNIDKNKTFNELDVSNVSSESIKPYYPVDMMRIVGPPLAPDNIELDSIFYYSHSASQKENKLTGENLQKRAFVVNFQPPSQAGWYKLRFASKTNRILGVKGGMDFNMLDDATTVNIGTVQLTVEDLKKVKKELEATLERFNLPSLEELVETRDVDQFKSMLNEAKMRAGASDDAEDMVSKVNLYGYIVQLLAPGMSGYFAQNQGSMEFNIRVVTPKPQIAEPVIAVTDYVASFDEVKPSFELGISPYQDNNVLEGRIEDASGAVKASISFTPLDQMAGSGVSAPTTGKERRYRAIVNESLPPGRYKAKLAHKLLGKEGNAELVVEVFETGLTEESLNRLNTLLNFAYYGYPMNITATPTSGGKIPADQFKIHLQTDAPGSQEIIVRGLSATGKDALTLKPEARNLTLKVTWEQPITNQVVDIFPEKTVKIKQEGPTISQKSTSAQVSGPPNKMRLRIDGIMVSPGITGSEKPADVSLEVQGEPSMTGDLENYRVSVEPILSGSDKSYSVELELSGKLERGQNQVSGTITIPVRAVCVNPVNGIASEPVPATIRLQVDNHEFDQRVPGGAEGGRRRR